MIRLSESPASLPIYVVSKKYITMAAKQKKENAADQSRSDSSACKT